MMRFNRSFLYLALFLLVLPFTANSKGNLKSLNEESWEEMLDGEWMVEFYAPWCPACRQLQPIWDDFSSWGDDLGIQVGSVDVTTNPGLSGRFAITALPTIFHVKEGIFRQYRGSKRKEELISFIEDAKWSDIDPIPGWKSPNSFQMSSLAHFFKLSMLLRNVHGEIMEYGIPYWGSYVIFGILTILMGTVLGLVIVCVIDYICPTKKTQQHQTASLQPTQDTKPTQDDKPTPVEPVKDNYELDEDTEIDESSDEQELEEKLERMPESMFKGDVRRRQKFPPNVTCNG